MSQQIARTLIAQLGNLTLSMLGAHSLVSLEAGLQFGIKGSRAVNKIVITLEPDDTYTVASWKIRGAKMVKVHDSAMVYADSLHAVIKTHTGLETRM